MAGYTEQDKDRWIEIAQDTGVNLEATGSVPVLQIGDLDSSVSIPGVKFTSIVYDENGNATEFGKPESYGHLPLGTIGIKTQAADTAANRANTAADGAENVDATLVGMTVTITDRNGDSHSVNIGFEITPDHVYASKADMLADAENVEAGKFCMIATSDPTATDNATLWSRNTQPATSEEPYTFLSDLDQAATHVWDDWNQNLRQSIVDAINTAAADHTQAGTDHATATTDHSTAVSDHNIATSDHIQAQSDHSNYTADRQTFATDEAERQQTFETNEAQRQQDFEDAEAERMAAMVVTQCYVDASTMSLVFVQPARDTTQYKVLNGDLNIIVTYD